jgi:hypothetical protein
MRLRYQIVLHESEEGYAVNCPALPGCWSQGETEQEAMRKIRDAIEDILLLSMKASVIPTSAKWKCRSNNARCYLTALP